MGDGSDDTWRVWRDLDRKENELAWGGHQARFGHPYDSMGRPTDALFHLHSGWVREQMGRVDRVRQALDESGPMAQRMIAQRLSGINLSTIWNVLVSACKDIALLYGGSVVVGGFIGGVGGAFLGGVGAVPGASAGAAAGGYVGGWVLGILGLKSLVEGVVRAIPEALHHYERGFREAWGPTPHDHLNGSGFGTGGSSFHAAAHLANGHVIMISAILATLVAYITKGRGDKAALFHEIAQSPRLGPKVAKWVEQNEDQLRKQPALQSIGSGAFEPPALPPVQPPQLKKRRQAPRRDEVRYGANGMPRKRVPCFKPNGLPQGSVPEFDRQLAGQEAGINNMTVDEYIKGREAFESRNSVRNSSVARQARFNYLAALVDNLTDQFEAKGVAPREAEHNAVNAASDKMKTLAALHTPDRVAGGKDLIGDFGDRNINSRIGALWRRGGRLAELDKAANAVPEAMRSVTKMNASLERCK